MPTETSSQIPLPLDRPRPTPVDASRIRAAYANDDATPIEARVALELKYAPYLRPTDEFNRRLVSYQANKQARLHNWLKYKEGFSAQLVEILLSKFGLAPGDSILEPFAGSATTLLVAMEHGINATGIELLPVCHLAWEAKSQYHAYDTNELQEVLNWVRVSEPGSTSDAFPHLVITGSAFPASEEAHLMWYSAQFASMKITERSKLLLRLVLMSILEDISYTRKDGQYLRWDSRSSKAQGRDRKRQAQNKSPYKTFDKGKVLTTKLALIEAVQAVIRDIEVMQQGKQPGSQQTLLSGTVLEILPTLAADQYQAVITSPPYCNRYDYTRTYALELAYLGFGEDEVRQLRQQLLSCTVENRSKLKWLQEVYASIGRTPDFLRVIEIVKASAALQEVFEAIKVRGTRGELNNKGVIRMIEGYFTELAFVIYELQRVCKGGAKVAIVNDNVRYGGEVIPVDLLMTDLASEFGFRVESILVLPQRKGNSSQQMGKYGREANRKSITVWSKA